MTFASGEESLDLRAHVFEKPEHLETELREVTLVGDDRSLKKVFRALKAFGFVA